LEPKIEYDDHANIGKHTNWHSNCTADEPIWVNSVKTSLVVKTDLIIFE